MAGINNRIFGNDIPSKIKAKLIARQAVAASFDINESIDKSQYTTNFNGIADLSSRTPFARLWVAVQHEESISYDKPKRFITIEEAIETAERLSGIVTTTEDDAWEVKQLNVIDTKVYIIGQHVLSQISSNEPIDTSIFTNELQSNEFFKPPAGITSVNSTTEGVLGAIKKTTANFIVHNFNDFEKIYSRYFLRHGAQVFVDFGWDTQIQSLYDPNSLIENGNLDDIEEKLYGEKGVVTNSAGDLETLIGYVVNYDVNFKENGSIECSIEIVSKNTALVERDFDKSTKKRLIAVLDLEILKYASSGFQFGGQTVKYVKDDVALEKKISDMLADSSHRWMTSPQNKTDWEEVFFMFAEEFLKNIKTPNIPDKLSSILGVFYAFKEDINNKEGYSKLFISWGLFEDAILINEFGFNFNNNKTQIKTTDPIFDSSNTFLRYNANLFKSQKYQKDINKQHFLFPINWDKSYNTEKNKSPDRSEIKDILSVTKYDMNKNRIPLREIFISTEMIKTAISNSTDIISFIKNILDTINSSSEGIFDLQVSSNKYSQTQLGFVDRNLILFSDDEDDKLNDLFVFKPGSKNSIVKTYNLSLTTPKNGLQNMIAIQSLGAETNILSADDFIDKIASLDMIEKKKDERIIFLPRTDTYKGIKLQQDQLQGLERKITFFGEDDYFKSTDLIENSDKMFPIKGILGLGEDDMLDKLRAAQDETDVNRKNKEKQDTQSEEEMESLISNTTWVGTRSEYYMAKAKQKILRDHIPTLIPITLSLSIYGISSLVPGDLFKIDYLPKKYRDNIYFQLTKVSHTVDSTWTTELETVMRIIPKIKKFSNISYGGDNIILTKRYLDKFQLKDIETLKQYVMDLKPIEFDKSKYHYIMHAFEFTLNPNYTKSTLKFPYRANKISPRGYKGEISFSAQDHNQSFILFIDGSFWSILSKNQKDFFKIANDNHTPKHGKLELSAF